MPIEKLRTPAGIDHDYNFISAIDRAKQRAERDIVEELKLMREDELHPKDEDKAFYKIWRGDQLYHVVGKRPAAAIDSFDKHVRRRLKEMDIEAKGMPKGMARQKENSTTFNRRNKCINWQVEWFVYGAEGLFDQQPQQPQGPTRILCKGLDNKPLNQLLDRSIEWHRGQLDYKLRRQQEESVMAQEDGEDQKPAPPNKRPTKRKRLHEFSHQKTQDPTTGAWPANNLLLQYSLTGQWNQWATYCATSIPLTEAERAERYAGWRFYLHQTGKPVPGGKKALIPIGSRETLAQVLRGRTVVEFPTVYVFPSGLKGLPEGFVEGSAERRGRKRKIDETDSSESESSSEDSDSGSGSSSSSSSDEDEKEDGEVDGHAAKKVKRDTNNDEVRGGRDSRDGNDRNRFNSRGGRERGRGGGRGRGGRDRGGQRGRGRGQQNPRGRIYGGRPDSRGGRDINNSKNTRAGDQSEEEGEIMSDGRPPETQDIVTEVPSHQGHQRMGVASQVPLVGEGQNMWVVNQASMTGAEQGAETSYGPTISQQQQQSKAPGLGLVDYDSDGSD